MLGKLLKHELRATARIMLPVYILLLVSAGLYALTMSLAENYDILVLNIFPAGEKACTELRARINKTNEYVNEMLKDYPNLQIMDLSAYWLDGNGSIPKFLMKDFVHPGQLGYKLWGAAVEPVISSLLGVDAKPVME